MRGKLWVFVLALGLALGLAAAAGAEMIDGTGLPPPVMGVLTLSAPGTYTLQPGTVQVEQIVIADNTGAVTLAFRGPPSPGSMQFAAPPGGVVLDGGTGNTLTIDLDGNVHLMPNGETALRTGGDLTVRGTGELGAWGGTPGQIGLDCGGQLTLENEAGVFASSGGTGNDIGIRAASLTLRDASSLAGGGSLHGVSIAGDITLASTATSPSQTRLNGGAGATGGTGGVGLYCGGNLTVSGTGAMVNGYASGPGSIGLHCAGNITASGTFNMVNGAGGDAGSVGLRCDGDLTLSDELEASGNAQADSTALLCAGAVTASGKSTVSGVTSAANALGIDCRGALSLRDQAILRLISDTANSLSLRSPNPPVLYGDGARVELYRFAGSESLLLARNPATAGAFVLDPDGLAATADALTAQRITVRFPQVDPLTGAYPWVSVTPAVPTPAQQNQNLLVLNDTPALGVATGFTAIGARQNAPGVVVGDMRWQPLDWSVATRTAFPAGGPFTASFTLDTPGAYTLTVRYQEQRWDGTAWQPTGSIDQRQQAFTLDAPPTPEPGTTPAPGGTVPPTGDGGQMGLYLALLCAALGVWALARRRKTA